MTRRKRSRELVRVGLFAGLAALLLGTAAPPPAAEASNAIRPPAILGENLVQAPSDRHPHDLMSITAAAMPDQFGPPPPPIPPLPSEGMRIVVSIPEQMLYLFENGSLLATSPVSTGKSGHATPVGTFQILQKKRYHRSNLYNGAPMPFMQRLTWDGVALHAGYVPGYPASHGCIRLPSGFAQTLYRLTGFDTWVTVIDAAPDKPEAALALAEPFDENNSA